MRIAMFLDAFPVWTETFILNQITGMIDKGHEVDLYARGQRHQDNTHKNIERYNLMDNVTFTNNLSRKKMLTVFPCLLLKNFKLFKLETWKLLTSALKSSSIEGSWAKLTFWRVALMLMDKRPYDVVHCQFGMIGLPVLYLKQMGALEGKLVTSFRGHDATQSAVTKPGFYDSLFKHGELFLPVSNDLKKRIIALGCDPKKIKVLHSGIDCSKFNFKERHIENGEPMKLATIARFVEMKGLSYAIEAVASLITSGYSITYNIIGDGVLRSELEALIKSFGVEHHIHLLGWKNHEEVVALLNDSHLLIAPSVTAKNGETEGIPNAVKEAMALGMPVLSTHHSGLPELVENGVSGYLVPERDASALKKCLSHLSKHPELWPQMGKAGRQHIEKEFDITQLNNNLESLYLTTQ